MIENLNLKLSGQEPVTREELFELVDSWGRKDSFSTEENPIIRVIKSNPTECYDLSNLDVSNIENVSCLFEFSMFNGDLSKWNLESVQSLDWLFRESDFNNDSICNWDMSNKKSLVGIFSYSKFNGDLSNWDVSNCKDMSYMFYCNKHFNNDSLKYWNMSNVIHIEAMFKLSYFNGDISKWDISNVLNMDHLFYQSIFDGDISYWNINKNCNTKSVFYLCDNFNNKYVLDSKEFLNGKEDFKIWFERNKNYIREINEPKEKVLDFFSFDKDINIDQ